MLDLETGQFPHVDGPDDDVLTEFGISREGFVTRLREILLQDSPPEGLHDADVATLLAACS
ncbi:hypothetical protein HQ346_05630 [Rhodococcus sp. BP-252]|uniref:Uncharacterized protein n=2 Tax=Nocardiaceae TaxID=85025 RepID=A0A177YBQ1_9NOCA|nr:MULTISPECIES: hypothetical protein [Rhodococcus]MBY6411034.1 hypothetical protein [Rhodococcus sp. BP-320]MBY6415693.1 hypothetical protein [Rhodococcus sp. BP-321]MBY6420925.1 hypothetical protein [Rhodococcus sp. BP-324]MBY6440193.1 hypothetical protein [Rhodococcus sp. BP-319]MBY6444736.1 hypothetical protein [Rhodococcus sp. BP-318]MBY6449786.1 hypothetical protein [Rhodococcus sp. BP-315]MBY6454371.1 hypothetical protein [Rhodococcus sp. BP-277]MBY6459210.1 hypothetical protein [Rho